MCIKNLYGMILGVKVEWKCELVPAVIPSWLCLFLYFLRIVSCEF